MNAASSLCASASRGRTAAQRLWARVVLTTVTLALLAAALPATAQSDDARTVRVVVPAPPGGNLDFTARLVAERLAAVSGTPHVVENRPGANTMIGVESVVRAAPDGRTLLVAGTSLVINPYLFKGAQSGLRDLTPVAALTDDRYILTVPAQHPVTSLEGLDAHARSKAGGLNCASAPGPMMLACEQMRHRLGGVVQTIPFAGVAPALNALAGGHVDLMFISWEAGVRQVESGKLRALAVSVRTGLPAWDRLPVLTEVWPGFVLEGGHGVYLPPGAAPALVRQINQQVQAVLNDPAVAARLREGGSNPLPGSVEAFVARLTRLQARYGEVTRMIGLQPQ